MNSKLLDKIKTPKDLKKLSDEELELLAVELREYMVSVVSKTGGHLASSLGAVDATLAMYSVYDLPKDKILWDVGHQTYAHKILTGRKNRFKTLRQHNGLSGFLKRHESKYDAFGAGHSSTAISAAMGFAKARDIRKQHHNVVAVLGDSSLANGMSLEAINNIGHDKTDILVVVIDNEMSISPSVGALSEYLSRITSGQTYNKVKDSAKKVLDKMPASISGAASNLFKHFAEAVKGVISPGLFFEELGFIYYGPINGHNIKLMRNTMAALKKIKGPKLLHLITKKGKGYPPAEHNPVLFHGIGHFNPETGEAVKFAGAKAPSYSKVFSEALVTLAGKNKKIIAIVAAMIEGTNLLKFKELYPKRFFDVGIAEEHAATFAAGLAAEGFKPVVAIYSTFMQRCFDQMQHDAALQNLPVIFAMDRVGLVGEDGPTHHGVFDIAFCRMIPNMTVMAPSDAPEMRKLLATAFKINKGPVAFRFPRGESWAFKQDNSFTPVQIGKARMIKTGKDVTVVSLGALLPYVIKAAEELEREHKISVEIIDARFAKPIDKAKILKSAVKTRRVITIEEGCIEGGFGQAVLDMIKRHAHGTHKIKCDILGIPDRFIEQGSMEMLREECGLTEKGIKKAILNIIKVEN